MVKLPDDLEIVVDLTDPDPGKLPVLDFDTINSDFFIKKLLDMDERGLLRSVPGTAVTITSGNSIEYMGHFTGSGHEILFDPPGNIPTKPGSRPYVIVGFWFTNQPEYPEVPAILEVYKWKNFDNTAGFFAFLWNTGPKSNAEEVLLGVRKASYRNDIIPTGTIMGKGAAGDYCTYWSDKILGSSSYCPWYYANPEVTLAPGVFEKWEDTGILSNKVVSEDGTEGYMLPITAGGYHVR
jgi:hypothetical protein